MSSQEGFQSFDQQIVNTIQSPTAGGILKSPTSAIKSNISELRKSVKSIHSSLKSSIKRHPLMTEEHILKYRQLFDDFDVDKGGTLDLGELKDMLKSVGQDLTLEELQEIIADFDDDNSGEIDFEEFLQIFLKILQGADA